ncbi:MAG: sialidase family protein [Spirosomataceae bacterium]
MSFFVVLALLLFSSCLNFAQQANTIIVSEKQFVTPVLKGKADNPIIRLNFWSENPTDKKSTLRLVFNTVATTQLKALKVAKLYYCGMDSLWSPTKSVLFGTTTKFGVEFSIEGNQPLQKGNNYFWLMYELTPDADLSGLVDATCTKVILNKKKIASLPTWKNKIQQRIGIALRQHNEDQIHTYRIPGLTTTNQGSLLAVYDVRRDSGRDLQGDIDIGVSRSTDGGKTWEPMRIGMDMGKWGGLPEKFNGVSDACILVDKNSNTIYLAGLWMYGVINDEGKWLEGLNEESKAWNHQWRTKGSQPGFDVKQTAQFLIVKSTDDGKTWGEPINLTTMCKKEEWWLWAPAPGHGITLADSTLVFPTQGRDKAGTPFSNITFSKDGGKTWTTSQKASAESTTENMAVQLTDGTLMLNMRANKNRGNLAADNGREVAVTQDLGMNWIKHPSSNGGLPEPTCMASIHRHDFTNNNTKQSILLFSNPNSKTDRDYLTLKVSKDDGKNLACFTLDFTG